MRRSFLRNALEKRLRGYADPACLLPRPDLALVQGTLPCASSAGLRTPKPLVERIRLILRMRVAPLLNRNAEVAMEQRYVI